MISVRLKHHCGCHLNFLLDTLAALFTLPLFPEKNKEHISLRFYNDKIFAGLKIATKKLNISNKSSVQGQTNLVPM